MSVEHMQCVWLVVVSPGGYTNGYRRSKEKVESSLILVCHYVRTEKYIPVCDYKKSELLFKFSHCCSAFLCSLVHIYILCGGSGCRILSPSFPNSYDCFTREREALLSYFLKIFFKICFQNTVKLLVVCSQTMEN